MSITRLGVVLLAVAPVPGAARVPRLPAATYSEAITSFDGENRVNRSSATAGILFGSGASASSNTFGKVVTVSASAKSGGIFRYATGLATLDYGFRVSTPTDLGAAAISNLVKIRGRSVLEFSAGDAAASLVAGPDPFLNRYADAGTGPYLHATNFTVYGAASFVGTRTVHGRLLYVYDGNILLSASAEGNGSLGTAQASIDPTVEVADPYASGATVTLSEGIPGAVNPVPEPAVWALLVGGLGATGVALRRRRAAVLIA